MSIITLLTIIQWACWAFIACVFAMLCVWFILAWLARRELARRTRPTTVAFSVSDAKILEPGMVIPLSDGTLYTVVKRVGDTKLYLRRVPWWKRAVWWISEIGHENA